MQNTYTLLQRSALIASFGAATLLLSPVALAANSAQTQYQADVQRCNSTPGIDKKACLHEAGAALQATRTNALTDPSTDASRQDRTQRCNALPADKRQDCLTLMDTPNARTQGSVEGGGVLRETTITVPAGSGN